MATTVLRWRTSSFSNGNGGNNCVQIAHLEDGHVAVRDSKHPDRPALNFTAGEWNAFLAGCKAGEFDHP